MIKIILEHLAFIEESISEVEQLIDEKVKPYQQEVELLDTIPGVDKTAAQSIIAEVGVDMDVFPSADHLASWAGLSPGNHESAGKKKVLEFAKETTI
jgi:transposase